MKALIKQEFVDNRATQSRFESQLVGFSCSHRVSFTARQVFHRLNKLKWHEI